MRYKHEMKQQTIRRNKTEILVYVIIIAKESIVDIL